MPNIIPVSTPGAHRTGGLSGLTAAEVSDRLGFKSNVTDDPAKVKHSWGFTVDGVLCGVWDYKGSDFFKRFSTYGPAESLAAVFGAEHITK